MGLPSPCLQSHVGDQIPCGHGPRVCDGHGRQLDSASLPGGSWDDQHDDVAEVVLSRMLGAGVPGRREPRDIFSGVLPVDALRRRDGLRRGQASSQMLCCAVCPSRRIGELLRRHALTDGR